MSVYDSNYNIQYGSTRNSPDSSAWYTWCSQMKLQVDTGNKEKFNSERQLTSFENLLTGKGTLEDVMREFQMNGSDSPYIPDENGVWTAQTGLNGMGPSGAYLRQKSWPEPDRTPVHRLPKSTSDWVSDSVEFSTNEFSTTSTVLEDIQSTPTPVHQSSGLTDEQVRVLNSLPNTVLFPLLRELEQAREGRKRVKKVFTECRFCKNNGERECYYRSHLLKDEQGRVTCPVLRAFVCSRCGARGDYAHTAKYCPLTTEDERMKSAAMMRSVRMASERRRNGSLATSVNDTDNYVMFGETTPSVISDINTYTAYAMAPLDPLWAALEQKLML